MKEVRPVRLGNTFPETLMLGVVDIEAKFSGLAFVWNDIDRRFGPGPFVLGDGEGEAVGDGG